MINFPNSPTVGQIFNSGTGPIYIWDGVAWSLVGPSIGLTPDFVQGLTLAPNGTTSIDVNPGSAKGNGLVVASPGLLTKSLAATFVAGTGGGGLDTGVKQASKTYFVFEIVRQIDNTADTLISLSPSAPTLPAGWNLVQRIAAIKTDSSGNILTFSQVANRMTLTAILELSTTGGMAAALRVIQMAPLGISTKVRMGLALNAGAASTIQLYCYSGLRPNAMGADVYWYVTTAAAVAVNTGTGYGDVDTNTAGQIYTAVGMPAGNGTATFSSFGWDDYTIPRIGA